MATHTDLVGEKLLQIIEDNIRQACCQKHKGKYAYVHVMRDIPLPCTQL